jgi:predicted RNase H-like HicB family nuclease
MNDLDGFDIHLLMDDDGDWIAHFIELPNVSAGGVTPEQAFQELRVAWHLVKDSYQAHGERIPTPAMKRAA